MQGVGSGWCVPMWIFSLNGFGSCVGDGVARDSHFDTASGVLRGLRYGYYDTGAR